VSRNLPDLLVGATSNNSAIPAVEVRQSYRICLELKIAFV
jgi:hypothetical protein